MSRQPLSRRGKPGSMMIGPEALDKCAAFAAPIAKAILNAAHGDHDWATVLARMMGPETAAVVVVAMRSAVRRESAQNQALMAAADICLTDDLYRVFWAVQHEWAISSRDRNIFAHCIVGYSPEHPDLLLFVDPDLLAEWSSRIHANDSPFVIDPKEATTYKLGDAEEAANRIAESRQFILRLGDILWLRHSDAAKSQQTLNYLINRPRMIEALAIYDREYAKNKTRPKRV
jgi:hypothetical protein